MLVLSPATAVASAIPPPLVLVSAAALTVTVQTPVANSATPRPMDPAANSDVQDTFPATKPKAFPPSPALVTDNVSLVRAEMVHASATPNTVTSTVPSAVLLTMPAPALATVNASTVVLATPHAVAPVTSPHPPAPTAPLTTPAPTAPPSAPTPTLVVKKTIVSAA